MNTAVLEREQQIDWLENPAKLRRQAEIMLASRDIQQVIKLLGEVTEQLYSRDDHRAVFPDVYLVITRNVAYEIENETGFFAAPEFIQGLACRFAYRYLETLVWSLENQPQDCRAWAVAYDYASPDSHFGEKFGMANKTKRKIGHWQLPLLDAILGISAHINYDLSLGIYQTILELGTDQNEEALNRYKQSHDAVNNLLAKSLPETVTRLINIHGCPLTARLESLPQLRKWYRERTMHGLENWRSQVWDNVEWLLDTTGNLDAQQVIINQFEQKSAAQAIWLRRLAAFCLVV